MSQMDDENFEEPILKLRQEYLAIEGIGGEADKKRAKLERRIQDLQVEIYANLTPWQETLVARHPQRPYTLDYIRALFTDFTEFHGDRRFGDDAAIIGGTALFHGQAVVVLGHQKGRNAKERIERNFGMPRPEGYRKAERLMEMAAKFNRPIFTFIDTPGAYPGIEAEERGQAEAIARCIFVMAQLECPIIATVTGEGGSGGALAVGVADRVFMLEHSIYSVISPEGCAAILWRDATRKKDAAEALRITAKDMKALGIIDEIIPEALGGAHNNPAETAERLDEVLVRHLAALQSMSGPERVAARHAKFRAIGQFEQEAAD